jgi:hypothetical protein
MKEGGSSYTNTIYPAFKKRTFRSCYTFVSSSLGSEVEQALSRSPDKQTAYSKGEKP